ncbi:TcdA/TcdB pore-forming domain-containing protein [Pseudomonas sp. N40(2020)]|uniref:TcdA/TcdB pore-forming domain-containing protein n=1 Tax=Pseudomonas sp. N40(2020) TaxID=2767798 RepID=UPI00292A5152|nr:TcdA/TcdB pore-forming domain-containing protein [Pseudomonas sp. N40(2020)]
MVNKTVDVAEKVLSAKLFQETLASLLRQKVTPVPSAIDQIYDGIKQYVTTLSDTVTLLSGAAAPVPKVMHFVWVGGSEVGNIQRDYMNIWREVLKPQDYKFNLWYDSDALLAFEMNRVILDSARVHAMESGGSDVTQSRQLSQMIEDRARVLKNQMFDYLNQPQWVGRTDGARIELMVRAYGKDRATLEAFRQRCLDTHLAMVGQDLQLRDVKHEFAGHFLQDVYQREVGMRGNFAAASDVVRLQAEYLEGGRYSDMDYLPALSDRLGGVDISQFNAEARIGVLQLLLNHNEALMPGRDRQRYLDRVGKIPEQHQAALTAFALTKPAVSEIFAAPQQQSAPAGSLRLGTAHGIQAGGEMNAHFIAHSGSAMTMAYMQMIRLNYDCLLEVERRAVAAAIDVADEGRLIDVIQNVVNEMQALGKLPDSKIHFSSLKLIDAIRTYYQDGIRVDARGTIALTGPGAAAAGLTKYIEQSLQPEHIDDVRNRLKLVEGYNVSTEEEMISGWTVNDDPEQWLAKEREKWQTGKLKSRYAGDLNDLLKGQTLTFKQGWPLIEGRPVLLTSVLQQLMEALGDPFIRAMKDKLSGDITFDKPVAIGFDVRQQIIAQPVSELPLSHGAESTSHLNELFTRVAHGSLTVEQLSPLLRVMLGGMFGATRLDTSGFAGAWQQAMDLATQTAEGGLFARYNAIEKALRQHASPAFEVGLANARQPGTHTARELKVLALTDPLTLHQWGERIGQINSTAQREYHTQILRRGAQVRAELFMAGAISARQMPQDLLMRTPGDPGRRCYPLALLMAAALTHGDSAERALIGRVANASLTPEDADSRALLLALDELQALPLNDVGKPQGTHSLESIAQTLEAKTAPSVMLLDTGNHAMLVAKMLIGSQTVYRFYEPNFAIYGFSRVEELKQGMQRYLAGDNGAMARLYGLADGEAARFNVIELNTTELAGKVLASNTQLDSFLQSGPIVEAKTASVWEKQAVGRQRSLNENARMGAGLAQLDARYWAQEFDQASSNLRTEHSLGSEYLPLLDTLEQKPDAGYSVTLVDAHNPQNTRVVTTHDVRFSKVKQHIQRLVKTLAGKPTAVGEADGGSRLSFAFAIQTLITEMRNREYQAGEGQVPALSIALQVQVYVSYAQLGFGVLSDSVQLINLVRQVAASEQALALRQSSLSARLLGKASIVGGIGFSIINIGFDIYGLTVAENQEQRSRLATQLTFNVAALGLDIVALAVGGTVGAAAAFLSVPLLGVGIGVTAIASNLGQISDKAKGVGAHLRKVKNAYGTAGYSRKDGVLRFEPEAVITLLDLQKNQVSFDSQKFYPMIGGSGLPQYNDDPKQIHRAIDIRKALELPCKIGLIRVVPDDIQTVVLPCTPICYYGYDYQLGTPGYIYQTLPGERHEPRAWSEVPTSLASGFFPVQALANHFDERIETRYPELRNSAVEKLEYDELGNRRFYFTVNTPFPYILYKLYPIYKPTHIEVRLDEHVRQLLIPELPPEWKKLISYAITAQSGLYQLWLTPGVKAVTLDDVSYAKWVIHAPWAALERVTFDGANLIVDGIVLNAFEGMIELAKGELFQVDWQEKRLLLLSVSLEAKSTVAQVLSHLRKRAREKRLVSAYVPLYKYTVPCTSANQPVVTTAFYEVARDRLLYARDLPETVNEGVVLAGANAQHAWFYHPDHATVWRVDAVTGTVIHRYRLMNPASGAKIIGCVQDAHSTLRISQRMLEQSEVETTLEYRITGWAIELTGIKTSSRQHDYVHKPGAVYWSSLIRHFATSRPFKDATPGMGGAISTGGLARFVHARAYVLEGLREQAWLGLSSGRYFRAGLGSQPDMVMLVPHKLQDFAMLFYSKENGEISRGIEPRTAEAEYRNEVIERGVSEVTQAGERYIATKSDGRLFEIDPLGTLKFVGLGQRWLQRHPDWLSALPALAATYRGAPFPIIGLGSVSGSALLAVWCIEEQVLLADVAGGKELALLGLTPDKQAAWLLDVSAGQLYRQALVSIEALRGAFATGTRLLDPEQLPMAKKVWDPWSFAEVLVQGQGLLGRTREGVNLELLDQHPARIVGVEKQWASIAGQTPEQLQARLKALLKGQSHAPFLHVENSSDRYTYFVPELDQLFDISGRADGQWAVFLGTRNQSIAMLFDPLDSLNSSRESEHAVWVPGQYARREGEVLSLEMSGEVTDVLDMLPDGVDKLILGFGAQALSYQVSEQAWQRLDCIVVDPRRPLGAETTGVCTLMLDMDANERLLVSLVDGQLVFTDSDNAHSLIVRDVVTQGEEQGVAMQIGIKIRAKQYLRGTGEWLNALSAARGDEGHASVETLIKQLH